MKKISASDYSEYLKNRLKELGITHAELADALERSPRTVSGYINNVGLEPSDKIKEKIERILDEKSRLGNFTHIPPAEFAKMVEEYLAHFKKEINQEEFAAMVGMSGQSQISKITSREKNLTVREQYSILNAFLELCQKTSDSIDNNVHYDDREVYNKIHHLLYGWSKNPISEANEDAAKSGKILDGIIKKLIEYPVKIQDIMLENHLAFFDSPQVLYNDDHRFLEAEGYISIFRKDFSPAERAWFMYRLEELVHKNKVFSYHDGIDNWRLFETVTHYRSMIKSAKERRIADPVLDPPSYLGEPLPNRFIKDRSAEYLNLDRKNVDDKLQIRKFEKVFNQLLDCEWDIPFCDMESIILREIDFRLTMSPMEWYVWMLIAGYAFAYETTTAIDSFILKLKVTGRI